jgi:hypothetical protein
MSSFFFCILSWSKAFTALHLFSVFLKHFFQCVLPFQNFLQSRNVFSLSLFSDSASMALLVQGFSSRVLGIISGILPKIVCFSLFLSLFLDSAYYTPCCLAVLGLLTMFLPVLQSGWWVLILHSFFYILFLPILQVDFPQFIHMFCMLSC